MLRELPTLAFACLLAAFVSAPPLPAQADGGVESCDPPPPAQRPREATPAVGAREVTIDAPLRVRYTPGYFEPGGPGGDPASLITVRQCPDPGCDPIGCDDGSFVPGRAQILGDELVFLPDEAWRANSTYVGRAQGRDGDLDLRFCTGSERDLAPPRLGQIMNVTSDEVEPRCDVPDGGFRIATFFPPADDRGGPPGSIEYLLFQTRGHRLDGPILRDRVRNFSASSSITMAFVLPREQSVAPICVAVAAVDGVGNVAFSGGGESNCIDPVQGNFFHGLCAVGPAGAPASPALLFGFALGLAASKRMRRRRS